MGRFFNREAAIVAVGLLVSVLGIGVLSDQKPWVIAAATVGGVGLLHWPVTLWFQDWMLEYYVESKKLDRALSLGIEIRDSAMTRGERLKATIDVALIHIARTDYDNALGNLRKVVTTQLKPVTKAVVDGNIAYCLLHLDRELDRAEEYAQSGIKNAPQEPLFTYFLGLLRLKQGRHAEAKQLIAESLEREPDLSLPCPGERPWALAQALKGLGDAVGAKAELEKAKSLSSRFGELAAKELAGAAA